MIAEAGSPLAHLTAVIAVAGICGGVAMPKIRRALEQAKMDRAVAILKTIWHAQGEWRKEHGEFSRHLEPLVRAGLLADGPCFESTPYGFEIVSATFATFLIRANRAEEGTWAGSVSLDEQGVICGNVHDGEGTIVLPSVPSDRDGLSVVSAVA